MTRKQFLNRIKKIEELPKVIYKYTIDNENVEVIPFVFRKGIWTPEGNDDGWISLDDYIGMNLDKVDMNIDTDRWNEHIIFTKTKLSDEFITTLRIK